MENTNGEKIDIMMKSLSVERRKHLEAQINLVCDKLRQNNAKKNVGYTIEVTEKFDTEEPHQFVWVMCVITISEQPFMISTPNGIAQAVSSVIQVMDMEVYTTEQIDHWIDHVDRINKQENIYLENQGNVQESDENKNNEQNNEHGNNIIEDNNELTDEEMIIDQQWMFMPLFVGVSHIKKSKEDYLSIFYKHMRVLANRVMDTHINKNDENIIGAYNYIHNSFSNFMSDFEMCDFIDFTKSELEILGFMNWRNKIMMIPIWAFPCILKNCNGLILHDIHGNKLVVGKDYIYEDNQSGLMDIGFPFSIIDGNAIFKFEYEKIQN